CEICGFDFHKIYGELGKDFIEGHHTIPVSQLKEGEKTRIEDIIMVCSNCHRMLHRTKFVLTKEDLYSIIQK
ncbi:HNH endonuclease, partial [Bacillus anthracis]